MRGRVTKHVGDHLVAEKAPFSFALKEGSEEIRSSSFVYIKHKIDTAVARLRSSYVGIASLKPDLMGFQEQVVNFPLQVLIQKTNSLY